MTIGSQAATPYDRLVAFRENDLVPWIRTQTAWVAARLSAGADLQTIVRALPRDRISQMSARAGLKLACRAGCAHCCHQVVEVGPIEVLDAAGYLRATLTAQALLDLRRHLQAPPTDACGLLSDEGTCRIYRHRPLVCAGYNSLSAEQCAVKDGTHAEYRGQVELGVAIQSALNLGAEYAGLDGHPLDLTRALSIALERPDAEARWRAGESVFADAYVASAWSTVREHIRGAVHLRVLR